MTIEALATLHLVYDNLNISIIECKNCIEDYIKNDYLPNMYVVYTLDSLLKLYDDVECLIKDLED